MSVIPEEAPDDGDDLLKPAEVAAIYRVNPKTITRWSNQGLLTCVRLPSGHRRFRRRDLPELTIEGIREPH